MKKLLSVLLVVAMMTVMFTGCGGEGKTEPAKKDETSSKAENSIEAETVVGSVYNAPHEEWPAIGEAGSPAKVKIVIKDVLPEEEGIVQLKAKIEEQMAAHGQYVEVEFIEPPAGSYGTALPLGVRSGEIEADLIYFQGGDKPISEEGLLVDYTPYIENSNFIKPLLDPANIKRLENYPYSLWLAPARVAVPVMRGDWAAKLESYPKLLEDPTPDNYYAMFKEMKDKGMIEYAITSDGSLARWDSVFNQAFGITQTLQEVDGKVIYSVTTEAEKAKLEFYAKLYKDGLLDPEYLTHTWDVAEQKFYEGKVGLYATNAGATTKIINDKMVGANGAESELVVLPPAKGIGSNYGAVDITKEPRGIAINAESENIDAAFAVLEFMASPEGRVLDLLGIEGTHYNVVDNKIVFTERFPEWWPRFWETQNNFTPPFELEKPVYPAPATNSLEMVKKYYSEDVNELVPEDLSPTWDALKLIHEEFVADVVLGKKDISEFDKFVEAWNTSGSDQLSDYFKENSKNFK